MRESNISPRKLQLIEQKKNEVMDFVLSPSLKHMVLVKIATELWTREDFSLPKNKAERLYKLLAESEKKVLEKVRALPLPEPLKKEFAYVIYPIGEQWVTWCEYLYESYEINEAHPRFLPWTCLGTIDAEKRIQQFAMDRCLKPRTRYTLACDFGLAEHILKLSPKIPYANKKLSGQWFDPDYDFRQRNFGKFWSYYLNGGEEDLSRRLIGSGRYRDLSLREFAFNRAITFSYNPSAVKYFYAELNSEEKQNWISSFANRDLQSLITNFANYSRRPKDFLVEILRFLFSRMSENERVEIFKENPVSFLSSLLVWPYQSSFLPNVERMWECMSDADFEKLLPNIFHEIHYAGKVCYVRDIFIAFWQSSPVKLRRSFLSAGYITFFWLHHFIHLGEEGICRMILKEAEASVVKQGLGEGGSSRLYCPDKLCEKNKALHALFFG